MSNIVSDNILNLDKYSTIEYLNLITSDDSNDGITFDNQEHIRLTINNKTIEPINVEDILVEKDAYSRTIIFCMDRIRDGIDLFTKNIEIHYENANGESDSEPVPTKKISDKDENILEFAWTISDKVCYYPGNVKFSVEFFDTTGYRWFTKPVIMKVEEGIDADKYISTENWYLLWRNEAYKIVNQANDLDSELAKTIMNADSAKGQLAIQNTKAAAYISDLKNLSKTQMFIEKTNYTTISDVSFDSSLYTFLTACFRPFKDETNTYTVTFLRDYTYRNTFTSKDGIKSMEVIIEPSETEQDISNLYFNCDTEEECYIEYIVGSVRKMN